MLDTLNQIVKDGIKRGLAQNFTEDETLHGKHITLGEEQLLNFGSCSYLGLEMHSKLKAGVIDAVQKYGTQFSSSRTYLSLGLYKELEDKLSQMFDRPAMVSASTTLGHLATMPVVVGKNDAIILDLQVHSSIQMAAQLLKAQKVPIYVIQHNSMEALEKKIQHLNNQHDKIWYFADGVYSMYGDFAPFQELECLLDTYKKFHLYIDDAHGMSWTGENGTGVVRAHMKHHDKMVLAVSLNKTFAAAGGAIIFPNKSLEAKVRNCGSTMIFSGPIQPPMLGAACASADMHLSGELEELQAQIASHIQFTNRRLKELNLPQFMETESPVFFVPAGLPKVTYRINQEMRKLGFYLNSAAFPAVPMKKSGVRFMVNTHQTEAEIDQMLTTLQKVYVQVLEEEGSSCEKVAKVFRIPEFHIAKHKRKGEEKQRKELQINIERSILKENAEEWDQIFGEESNANYANIQMLEALYKDRLQPEEQWDFYYCTIRDEQQNIVLKTFFSSALVKDDMFAEASVSKQLEAIRKEDPYYLSSKQLMIGSLITKGKQLHINAKHPLWKKALRMLVQQMEKTAEQISASKILLREFSEKERSLLSDLMLEIGLVEYKLLNNSSIKQLDWKNREDYMQRMAGKYRYSLRKEILKFEDRFELGVGTLNDEETLKKAYELYSAVHAQAYALNVFKLPYAFFKAMAEHPNYDIIRLYLKAEHTESGERELVGVMFSHHHAQQYHALIVGLDYRYVRTHNIYKQILFKTVERARTLNAQYLDLAYTADLEKKKVGASSEEVYAYVQAFDHYSHSVIEAMQK